MLVVHLAHGVRLAELAESPPVPGGLSRVNRHDIHRSRGALYLLNKRTQNRNVTAFAVKKLAVRRVLVFGQVWLAEEQEPASGNFRQKHCTALF